MQTGLFDKIDVLNKSLKSLLPIAILIGSIILLYFYNINYFAYDISIGDGVYFVAIATTFGLIYLFFIICMTSVGLTFFRPIWWLIDKFINKTKSKIKFLKDLDDTFKISSKDMLPLSFIALFGIFWIVQLSYFKYDRFDSVSFTSLVVTSLVCAKSWNGFCNEFSTPKEKTFDLIMLLTLPLVFSGSTTDLINGTMNMLNIKQTNVTVHLKHPYTIYAQENGIEGSNSAFGDDYLKYTNVDILFTGLGKQTVFLAKTKEGKKSEIIIPNDSTIIITRK